MVYRRFPDKDALLRATYERVFARLGGHNRGTLQSPILADFPFLPRFLVLSLAHGERRQLDVLVDLVQGDARAEHRNGNLPVAADFVPQPFSTRSVFI